MNRQRIPYCAFLKAVLGGVLLGAGGLAYYARQVEPYRVAVERVTLELSRLAPSFDGYRVVQISDVHLDGWMTPERFGRIVKLVNEQGPDLVAITGDFVSSYSERHVSGLVAPLGRLEAPDGVVAVLGNHDHWAGADVVRHAISSAGVADVSNALRTVRRDGAALHLCGVDSVMEDAHQLDEVIRALDGAGPGAAVLLAHEPDFADESAATGRFDLQLSGHSHGGQVRVPFLKTPFVPPLPRKYRKYVPPLFRKYPSGLYRVGEMLQYTNRGLGVMQARLRVNCRPEITVFTFRSPEGEPRAPARATPPERLGKGFFRRPSGG